MSHDIDMRLEMSTALDRIMASVPFDGVTVQQICDEAHVSRPTFYRYFSGKDDVRSWFMHYIAESGTFQIGRSLTWHEGDVFTSTAMLSHRNLLVHPDVPAADALRASERSLYERYFRETVSLYHGVDLDERLCVQIHAAVVSRLDLIDCWVQDGMGMSVERLAYHMGDIVPEPLFSIVNDLSKSRYKDRSVVTTSKARVSRF
jgi:AcrR family transcriptional regulator